ncbi:MAG: ImmA/IrrE family metallo-endopeptidase [Actinomycetota bacterium]
MRPPGKAWQRSLQAAESAGRLLDELGVDATRHVDVFSMCEDVGLWLTFMPLDGLLGAFVPEGSGGVLITDRRSIAVQRYTAAHELGHWRLEHGHGLALDGEEHVFGATSQERERLAQVFAANLLMPAPLVLSLLARIGVGVHGPVGPRDAYFVAREAGVSYQAAVRQLANLEVITGADSTSLLRVRPIVVKSELAGGRRPVNGYADVWPVDEAWNDQAISLRADDEVVISLPENPSCGYRWMFDDEVAEVVTAPEPPPFGGQHSPHEVPMAADRFLASARTARRGSAPTAAIDRVRHHPADQTASSAPARTLHGGVAVVGDAYLPGRGGTSQRARDARRARLAVATGHLDAGPGQSPVDLTDDSGLAAGRSDPEPLIAATGRRLLGIGFPEAGPKTLRLQHRSPYSQAPAVEEFVLHALVEPRPLGFSIDQLVEDSEEAWVGAVRDRKLHTRAGGIDDPNAD